MDIPVTYFRRFYGLNYATELTSVPTSLIVRIYIYIYIYTILIYSELPEALGCQWVPTRCQNNAKINTNCIERIIFHLFVM